MVSPSPPSPPSPPPPPSPFIPPSPLPLLPPTPLSKNLFLTKQKQPHHNHPKIYLIRHGEKPPKLPSGKDADGLSTQGLERAQGLRVTFGKESLYGIGWIIAEHPKKDGSRTRPLSTVLPLSQDLGIKINDEIDRDDAKAVAKAAKGYEGEGNVLICWEHGVLGKIVEELGVEGERVEYPGERFDVIWCVEWPWRRLVWVGSENIPGLDDVNQGVDGDGQGGVGPVETDGP